MNYIVVFVGAGLGGMARHGLNVLVPRLVSTGLPVHTFIINVAGSFVMGLLAAYLALRGELPQEWRLFMTTGIMGGFTTFSAFSLETALLIERGAIAWAAAYVVGSVVFSIAALFLGLALVRPA
jgi:CrcB protein